MNRQSNRPGKEKMKRTEINRDLYTRLQVETESFKANVDAIKDFVSDSQADTDIHRSVRELFDEIMGEPLERLKSL